MTYDNCCATFCGIEVTLNCQEMLSKFDSLNKYKSCGCGNILGRKYFNNITASEK